MPHATRRIDSNDRGPEKGCIGRPERLQGIVMPNSRLCRRSGIFALASALTLALGTAAYAHGPGFGYGAGQGPGFGPRGPHGAQIEHVIARAKDRLALNSSQQVMFDSALASARSAREAGRTEMDNMRAAGRAELAKPEPDLAALAAAADAAHANGQALRRQVRDEWLKLYATFSPTQKSVVREMLVQRMERHEHFRERMHERFGG
jgi:Spy/CpxP family protein refolding chaperone